jgi:hypothetical protein
MILPADITVLVSFDCVDLGCFYSLTIISSQVESSGPKSYINHPKLLDTFR